MNARQTLVVAALIAALSAVSTGVPSDSAGSQRKLVLRIVGPDGVPVVGAKVGTGLNLFEQSADHPPQTIQMWLRGRKRCWPFRSDAEGLVTLVGEDAEHRDFYILFESRGWVGYKHVLEGSTGSRVEIRLEPACRVHGQLTSPGMDRLGHSLSKTATFVYDSRGRVVMYFVSNQSRYEFLLPSGRYELECFGEGPAGIETRRLRWPVTIEAGQRDIDAGLVDLAPTRLAELYGKPAPELDGVTEWRGPPPPEFRRLGGSIVVLTFWASWSRPCLRTMPRLMELNDLWADQGVTMIGVHDNSVTTVAELETKMVGAHDLYWGRLDLPFSVGIDQGENWGAVHEAYGIEHWPTVVVIDTQGNVAGSFSPWGDLEAELSRLLAQR